MLTWRGMPTLSTGGIVLIIEIVGSRFMELIYTKDSLVYNFESIVSIMIVFLYY